MNYIIILLLLVYQSIYIISLTVAKNLIWYELNKFLIYCKKKNTDVLKNKLRIQMGKSKCFNHCLFL